MERVLKGLQWVSCLVYLDDIVIFAKSFDEMMSRLQEILDCLRGAGLKLKPSKCFLFQKQVAYLGHVVGRDGISCDEAKVTAVREWPAPKNLTDVRSFLGLVNYYRRFIPNCAEVATPMVALTQKGRPFSWDEHCQEAFEELKDRLTQAPVLAYPSTDAGKKFILDTDASGFAIGAVLSQLQEGEENVIAYASKSLNKAQRTYCTTYRELLAVVQFLKHFRHFLLGRRFLLRTDHGSLRWLMNFRDVEGMVGRWLAKLSPYDFQVELWPGKPHANAHRVKR